MLLTFCVAGGAACSAADEYPATHDLPNVNGGRSGASGGASMSGGATATPAGGNGAISGSTTSGLTSGGAPTSAGQGAGGAVGNGGQVAGGAVGNGGQAGAATGGQNPGTGGAAATGGIGGKLGNGGQMNSGGGAGTGTSSGAYAQVQSVIEQKCGICHTLGGNQPDLSTTGDELYQTLATFRVRQCGGNPMITPSNAAMSALVLVTSGKCGGLRMPQGCSGTSCVTSGEQQMISNWIAQGAKH